MRFAGLIALLAGCASGGNKDHDPEVDAAPNSDGAPDAQTCGGANQLPCEAVYVAKNGNDAATGTKGAPLKTINTAIQKAVATGKKAVFVKYGTYAEQVLMASGITVYGGFDDAWLRNPGVDSEILAASPALAFNAISNAAIDTFRITSSDATNAGDSSFAVVVKSSQMIELRDVDIKAGIGAAGADGADGVNGANGAPGMPGNPGVIRLSCSSNNLIPSGGVGGLSACGRFGGQGGAPGTGGGEGGNKGVDGAGGTLGGNGASGGHLNGFDGNPGMFGVNGVAGNGGDSIGVFTGTSYLPAKGNDGTNGTDANGGGGGGGGGGGSSTSGSSCTTTGSSAGGGGAGGCGGTAGRGGGGGGGSFGVISQASNVTIRSSKITAGRGGAGGHGGNGSLGGTGGSGGAAGPYGGTANQGNGGYGFAGGRGGDGGIGGSGGGGGGGPSAAVVCTEGSSFSLPQTTLVMGSAGAGGASVGNFGAAGQVTTAIGCQFF